MAQKTVTIKEGQTIFDIALQVYGDVSKVYDLIQLNSLIDNITSNDLTGLVIVYEDPKNEVSEYYNTNSINIATRYPEHTTGDSFDDSFSDSFL